MSLSLSLHHGAMHRCALTTLLVALALTIATPAPAQPSTQPTIPAIVTAAARAASDAAMAGELIRSEQHNFSLKTPGHPWQRVDPRQVSPVACICLVRDNPPAFFFVIAEELGSGVTSESLADTAIRKLASISTECRVIDRAAVTVNDIPGQRVGIRLTIGGRSFGYVNWYAAHNGFVYQLITGSSPNDEAVIRESVDKLINGFSVIDSKRTATPAGLAALTAPPNNRAAAGAAFSSPMFGYRLGLTDPPGWRLGGAELNAAAPDAECGLLLETSSAVIVIPVYLMGREPDIELLARALTARMNIPWDKVWAARDITVGPLKGREADFLRHANGADFACHLKVLRGGSFAYLVTAWSSDPARLASLPAWTNGFSIERLPELSGGGGFGGGLTLESNPAANAPTIARRSIQRSSSRTIAAPRHWFSMTLACSFRRAIRVPQPSGISRAPGTPRPIRSSSRTSLPRTSRPASCRRRWAG